MKNRPITSKKDIEEIIAKCEACNLAMVDQDGFPYGVIMNFGYAENVFYFHSSPVGKKIELLKMNDKVALSLSTDHQLRWQSEKMACSYGMKYRSVFARGKVEFIEDFEEKKKALDIIMKQYTDRSFKYSDPSIKDVCVFKVAVDSMEGRVYGY